MNNPIWDRIEADWQAFEPLVLGNWLKLTGDDVTGIAGNRDRLLERIQARYGVGPEEAEREVREWEMRVGAALEQ